MYFKINHRHHTIDIFHLCWSLMAVLLCDMDILLTGHLSSFFCAFVADWAIFVFPVSMSLVFFMESCLWLNDEAFLPPFMVASWTSCLTSLSVSPFVRQGYAHLGWFAWQHYRGHAHCFLTSVSSLPFMKFTHLCPSSLSMPIFFINQNHYTPHLSLNISTDIPVNYICK